MDVVLVFSDAFFQHTLSADVARHPVTRNRIITILDMELLPGLLGIVGVDHVAIHQGVSEELQVTETTREAQTLLV